MKENLLSGLKVNDARAQGFVDHILKRQKEHADWIRFLKKKGYKAAHALTAPPYDGQLIHAYFNYYPQVGDLVALGDKDFFITVQVLEALKRTSNYWNEFPLCYRYKYRFGLITNKEINERLQQTDAAPN